VRSRLAGALVLLLNVAHAHAADERVLSREELQNLLLSEIAEAAGTLEEPTPVPTAPAPPGSTAEALRKAAEAQAIGAPESPLSGKQISAPSTVPDQGTLASGPSFTQFAALAIDSNLIGFGDGSLTISLSPFAFVALARPDALDRPSLYPKYALLRRLGGSLTFGGTGDRRDRDGDGDPEPAQSAERLDDIVTLEGRIRLFGSRDLRERETLDRYLRAVDRAIQAYEVAEQELLLAVVPEALLRNEAGEAIGYSAEKLSEQLVLPEVRQKIRDVAF
jgi:hypothetical protein